MFSSCTRELVETMTRSSISCAKIRPECGAAAFRRRGTGQTMTTNHPSTGASLKRSHSTIESEGEYTIGVYYDAEGNIEMSTPIPVSITLTQASAAATNGDSAEESAQLGGI